MKCEKEPRLYASKANTLKQKRYSESYGKNIALNAMTGMDGVMPIVFVNLDVQMKH
jgi:hypothetical protein